jgi:hypothetical protein
MDVVKRVATGNGRYLLIVGDSRLLLVVGSGGGPQSARRDSN